MRIFATLVIGCALSTGVAVGQEICANTFSIVAADPRTSEVGVAVATRLPAVGMYVPFVEESVGAVASQAIVNPQYGPLCLDLLRKGVEPEEVIRQATSADPQRADRQLSVVSPDGRSASFTGSANSQACGHLTGPGYAVAGNLLASTATLSAMAEAFERTEGRLSDRLLAALEAGDRAGGDKRGKQSAAILVKRPKAYFNGKVVDLRVDDSPNPIAELRRVHAVYMSTFLNLPGYRVHKVGDQGADVRKLNDWLNKAGYLEIPPAKETEDRFTSATLSALEKLAPGTGGAVTPELSYRLEHQARRGRRQ